MRLPRCIACDRSVLELEGQFESFDSFYLEPGGPDPDTVGAWHLACLLESPHGPPWSSARHRNYIEVRRYERVADPGSWTVIRNPNTRETLALARSGEMLSLTFKNGRARRVDGGAIYRVDEEYNLEVADRDAIQAIRDALTSVGTIPILALFEVLGIADRAVHPEALEGSVFHGARNWGADFVAARADYGVFVPTELVPYVTRKG